MERNALFYMANVEPEIARMFRAHDGGKSEETKMFQEKSLKLVDQILASNELNSAGREEWSVARSMIEGFASLDGYSRAILQNFALPFSEKFAMSLS